jgi:hypothetical protein
MSNSVLGPLRTQETGAANEQLLEEAKARIKAVQAHTAASIKAHETPVYKLGMTAPPPLVAGGTASSSPTFVKETKQLESEAAKGGLLSAAAGAIGSAGKTALNAPGELLTAGTSDIAGEVASGLFGDVKEAVGADFVKGLLYLVLAGGGAMLIITGFSRSTGLHPAQGAKKIAGAAATGAMLA